MALVLKYGDGEADAVNHRLNSLIAVFFVVQIVLPFTAPLHSCDLNDILGTNRKVPATPRSATTPAPASEASAEDDSYAPPFAVSTLTLSGSLMLISDEAAGAPVLSSADRSSSPQVQQTILRL